MKTKNDGCLTSFLVFIIVISGIALLINIIFINNPSSNLSVSHTLVMNNLILTSLQIVAALLMLMREKIGVYMYIFIGITNAIITFIFGKNLKMTLISIAFLMIPYIILYFLLRRNKKMNSAKNID
ncbi:hypothetical protein OSSY52_08710 [Tepiditoga spiralis]|uniref:Uncharacterized protein n=1 Tax=Tepiditoga spiralis TaxID=2108365 RepID=A0A7G1G2V0_9BACT|nr:hypothetical protein [Tepiditoga spiralis]BBE30730.1 hypothetical protein OSSY52_08710 [Tepiditoga spiralis]